MADSTALLLVVRSAAAKAAVSSSTGPAVNPAAG
jgi:hypothetical protein